MRPRAAEQGRYAAKRRQHKRQEPSPAVGGKVTGESPRCGDTDDIRDQGGAPLVRWRRHAAGSVIRRQSTPLRC